MTRTILITTSILFLLFIAGTFPESQADAAATSVTLSAQPGSPQPTGVTISFTAQASGGSGSYKYKFQQRLSTESKWTTVRVYRLANTWKWNTTGLTSGEYRIRVMAREADSTAPYEARKVLTYTLTAPIPAATVTLGKKPKSPSESGTPVTLTATASGGNGVYQYRYDWKMASDSVWTLGRPFSTIRKWTWDTAGLSAGLYRLRVTVHTVDTPYSANVRRTVRYTLTAPAPSSGLPDTGQTQSYTGTFGEDSDYTINPPSYTANGNGTVTDNVTGLMWQQEDDGTAYNWYRASGTYDATYNAGTVDVCGSLTLGGFSDWRLPDVTELSQIVDRGTSSPVINAIFTNAKGNFYWSATRQAESTTRAWTVNFWNGADGTQSGSVSTNMYVRCVRGAEAVHTFTDNGNGTLTDEATGLLWQTQDNNATLPWEGALTYCEGLTLGGQTGWRLPNVNELRSITDLARRDPAIDPAFAGTDLSYYWTSTTNAGATGNAWSVLFLLGSVESWDKTDTNYAYVRCVRGGR